MNVPDIITCVDCGRKAHRMTEPGEDGWEAGDFVAYRCSGCNDRWDLVIEDPTSDPTRPDGLDSFDFRSFIADRDNKP